MVRYAMTWQPLLYLFKQTIVYIKCSSEDRFDGRDLINANPVTPFFKIKTMKAMRFNDIACIPLLVAFMPQG